MQYLKTTKQWRIAGNVKNTGAVLDTNSNLCSASTVPFWISESQDHVNAIPIRGSSESVYMKVLILTAWLANVRGMIGDHCCLEVFLFLVTS